MRILYLSQYFPPEVGATQTRAYEMARGLVRAGHDVTMIAEFPNHPIGIIPPEYRGKLWQRDMLDGIEVIRVWVKASPVKNFRTRIAFYLSYMISAALAGLFLARGKFDAIYATSPPLFVGGAALTISFLRRIPLFFEVRDLWPESAVALGELRNPHAIKIAEWLAQACYQRAKKIIVTTQEMDDYLSTRDLNNTNKVIIIRNGANGTLFQFNANTRTRYRKTLKLEDKFVVIYAGLFGVAQGLNTVIDTARLLAAQEPQIHFLLIGDGPIKNHLQQYASHSNLSNLTFLPSQPRNIIPHYLSAGDIALIPLTKKRLLGALPSKIFDAMACQRPVILSAEGEARQVLKEAQAGISVEPENSDALAKAILYLKENPALRQQMGKHGRRTVIEKYSRQKQAEQLEHILTSTLKD